MASQGGNSGVSHPDADGAPARSASEAGPKLRSIKVTNYKAIDDLVLEIPAPIMPGDPDVFVVGSRNGVGKTSLLECCAIAHLNRCDPSRLGSFFRHIRDSSDDVIELSRDAGTCFTIEARYNHGPSSSLEWAAHFFSPDPVRRLLFSHFVLRGDEVAFTRQFFGRSSNVLLHPDVLLFHSYRKIVEGSIRAQDMLTREQLQGSSAVKLKAIRLLMASSGLVEGDPEDDAERRLEHLNRLLSIFVGGRIDKKLRPVAKDQLDIRIVTSRGTTFSFDGLSSGQKEVVSTLFLIWNETLTKPALVLIDEPELHLNADWQREFIYQLHATMPHNQYILATHSEDIFASVSPTRRVMLLGSEG
jgi:ABC-type molybdenum transport system ATPase subunit/photorepair protein PhrA